MLTKTSITDYLKLYDVQWKNAMPEGCPPDDVLIPQEHLFYRYTLQTDKCTDEDFKTYRQQNPTRDWGELLPLASGLSVLDNLDKAKRNMKLPMLRSKFKGIGELMLNPNDGVVKQTGAHKSHYTWWQTTAFDMNTVKMMAV